MGLIKMLRKLDPEKKERIYGGIFLLGSILGHGDKALALVSILDSVPGRVDALKTVRDRIDQLAEGYEDQFDEGEIDGKEKIAISLTVEELLALDDILDLGQKGSRELKKLANKILKKR